MKELTETIIGLFDLAEAEGRLLQKKVIQTMAMIIMLSVAALFIIAAIGCFFIVIFQILNLYLEMPWVLLVMGSVCLIFAGVMVWFAMHINRRQ